jgi:hypothetical protein
MSSAAWMTIGPAAGAGGYRDGLAGVSRVAGRQRHDERRLSSLTSSVVVVGARADRARLRRAGTRPVGSAG